LDGSGNICSAAATLEDESYCRDRDYSTYATISSRITLSSPAQRFDYCIAVKITLPQIQKGMQFESVYLGLRATTSCENDSTDPELTVGGGLIIARRKYYGDGVNCVDSYSAPMYDNTHLYDSMPDDYYAPSINTKNQNFYYPVDDEFRLSGYKNYDLDISTIEEYNSIEEIVLIFKRHGYEIGIASYIDDVIKIQDVAVIFENTCTIGNELYA
jgi:hypothetical protein